MSESAWVLEGIARGLNCAVVSRRMIQNEIVEVEEGEGEEEWEDGGGGRDGNSHRLADDPSGVIVVEEPSALGGGYGRSGGDAMGGAKEGVGRNDVGDGHNDTIRLNTEEGAYTRCVLVIQRVSSSSSSSSRTHADIGGDVVVGGGAGGGNDAPTGSTRSILGCACDGGDEDVEGDGEMVDGHPAIASPSVSVEETLSSRNVRVAVLGNVDAGKSTLIGTLTTSYLDDGRGSTRTLIMKHRHEIESGRTSTSSSHLLGFNRSGEAIAGCDRKRPNRLRGEDDIARSSYQVVTLMDLAGHEKYLKTTIHGITSGMADYGLILVNSRHPPTHMTQHHLNLCCGYGIPIVVVFTKVDGCPDHALETSKKELSKLLRSPNIGRRPYAIKTEADVLTCIGKLHTLAPTLDVSCVTGEGLDLLRKILFALPKRRKHEKKANRPFEFLVEDVFSNVPGVGSVVSGFVNAGELHVGTAQVYVGPTDDGTFIRTTAKSAQISRINTSHVTSGQSATIALSLGKEMRKKLRRGMVVVVNNPTSTREFDAEICVLKGEGTTIRESYQAHVHTLNVRQTAYARNIEIINTNTLGLPPTRFTKDADGIVLRPGSRAKVRFEFANRPVSSFLFHASSTMTSRLLILLIFIVLYFV